MPDSTDHLARRLDRLTQSAALIGFGGLVIMALLGFTLPPDSGEKLTLGREQVSVP